MLADLVQQYLDRISRFGPSCDDCAACWEELPDAADLARAIRIAALSTNKDGKRLSHQRRIPASVLERVAEQLGQRQAEIDSCDDFEALHRVVVGVCAPIHGAGELLAYDVAFRIGAYLGIEPSRVYLHAGTRKGARHLGISGNVVDMADLPAALHGLKPWQAEDFLCIYAKHLKRDCTTSELRTA